LQDDEIVVACLFAKDAAQFFKACACGKFRALLVDRCARGAAFDAADRETADCSDQQCGGHHQNDDQCEARSMRARLGFFRAIHDCRSE
jgi:phage-related protein